MHVFYEPLRLQRLVDSPPSREIQEPLSTVPDQRGCGIPRSPVRSYAVANGPATPFPLSRTSPRGPGTLAPVYMG